jgi:hypothetical protein
MLYQDTGHTNRISERRNIEYYHKQTVSGIQDSLAGYLRLGIKNIIIYMLYQDTGNTSRISEPIKIERYHIQAVSGMGYRIHRQDI